MKLLGAIPTTLPFRDVADHFFSWWGSELRELLPDRIIPNKHAVESQLVIQYEGDSLICCDVSGNNWHKSGSLPAADAEPAERRAILAELPQRLIHGTAVRLLLPESQVLRRRVLLPVAARDNLRAVLSFEMDRQTPFRADQVYYDYVLAEDSTGADDLSVELVAVPRTTVDVLLDRVESLGIRLDSVEVTPRDGQTLKRRNSRINLLPAARRTRSSRRLDSPNAKLTAVAAALLIVALTLPIIKLQLAESRLEAEVAAIQSQAEQILELRERLQSGVEESGALTRLKNSSPAVIGVLAELARVLPDSTWLSMLEIQRGVLKIRGQSAASSELISLIEDSPTFRSASFASPVVQDPNTGRERFELQAQIVASG